MRTRDCRFLVSLSEKEMSPLMKKVERSGLTRDAYVRSLIAGYEIKETPPVEFFEVLKSLQQINNNMNQIAVRANSTGNIYAEEYRKNVDELFRVVNELLRKAYS